MKTAIYSAAAVATVLTATAAAHHSFAMFDQSKETTLDGTLTTLQWTIPHIWVQVAVKDPRLRPERRVVHRGRQPEQPLRQRLVTQRDEGR